MDVLALKRIDLCLTNIRDDGIISKLYHVLHVAYLVHTDDTMASAISWKYISINTVKMRLSFYELLHKYGTVFRVFPLDEKVEVINDKQYAKDFRHF